MPPAPPAGIAGASSLILATTDSVVNKVDATPVSYTHLAAIAANDKAAAEAALKAAVSELDKATKKGIYHKNTTARKVSRLTIAVNKLA